LCWRGIIDFFLSFFLFRNSFDFLFLKKKKKIKVVVLQEYRNESNLPIEAKYVFPLDETAAVCGFEGNLFIDSFLQKQI